MSNTTIIGIDTAKSVFYLHAMDSNGKQVFRKKLRRSQLLPFIAQHPPVTLAMEACGGNNYWARQFTQHHHQVKLIHAKHVKAYLHKNKNDYNDAEAIAEAASRSKTKRVPHKNISQQEIQSIHCLRESVMKNKVASANRIRGLLLEFGIPIPKSHTKLKINIPLILEDAENELTPMIREVIHEEYHYFLSLCERLKYFNKKIHQLLNQHQIAQHLTEIQGVGPLIATYLVSCISDTTAFKNGRECAASLGFTPREYSTGGKQKMVGIGRNGNKYLRRILLEGIHSIIHRNIPPTDRLYHWGYQLAKTKHKNLAVMAIANKIIRISFAIIQSGEKYCYQ